MNWYECDDCGEIFSEQEGVLARCPECNSFSVHDADEYFEDDDDYDDEDDWDDED